MVQKERAAQARSAALARQVDEQKWLVSEDKSRLRTLGRRSQPSRAALVVTTVVCVITGLGGYLFSQSSLHLAVWVNLLVWVVCLPSFAPAIFLERALALRAGIKVDALQKAWSGAQPFAIEGLPWDQHDSASIIRIEVHFAAGKPEPQLLADALSAVSSDVLVNVVAILGNEPELDDEDSMALSVARSVFDEAESLTDMRAQAMLSASGGGFVIAVRQRNDQYAEHWLDGWITEAVESTFHTIHRAYPIELLKVSD
jgi:hypothetical protein